MFVGSGLQNGKTSEISVSLEMECAEFKLLWQNEYMKVEYAAQVQLKHCT